MAEMKHRTNTSWRNREGTFARNRNMRKQPLDAEQVLASYVLHNLGKKTIISDTVLARAKKTHTKKV